MSDPKSETRPPYGWLSLIVLGSLLFQGYVVGILNHGVQLPIVRYFAGDSVTLADPMVQVVVRSYTSVFFPALGYAGRVLPMGLLLFTVFLLLRVASVWLSYRLAEVLWKDRTTSLWTAAALSVQTMSFGVDLVSDIYLNHGCLAQVIWLGSLLLAAQGRVVRALLLSAAMFYIHAMHSAHALVVLGIVALLSAERGRARLRVLAGGAAAVVVVLPMLVWMWMRSSLGEAVPADYAQTVRAWFPLHFFPSSWSAGEWTQALFPLVAAWPLWKLARTRDDGGLVARVAGLSLVLALFLGFVTEVFPHHLLMRLQPLRMSWLMTIAGLPFVARAGVVLMTRNEDGQRRLDMTVGLMLLLGLVVIVLYRSAYWLTLAPALWALAYQGEVGKRVRKYALPIVALLVVAVPAFILLTNPDLASGKDELNRSLRLLVLAEAGLAGLCGGVMLTAWLRGAATSWSPRARRVLLVGVGVIAALHLLGRGVAVWAMHRWGKIHDWHEVQRWCGANLPQRAKVMVPLLQHGFRVFSKQYPVVEAQEGTIMLHDPHYANVFLKKLKVYGWQPVQRRGYSFMRSLDDFDHALGVEEARRIGAATGAGYAIRNAHHPPWPVEEIFRNDGFVVHVLK